MKSIIGRSIGVLLGVALMAHSVLAGPFHTKIITATDEPLTLTIAQNVFLRIRNFTQEGGVTRATVMVTIGNQTVNILSASQIDANSIDTRQEQRDAHLKSADFFDVEKFPKLTFTSTRVPGDGVTTALLRARGIEVFSEEELDAADAYIKRLES